MRPAPAGSARGWGGEGDAFLILFMPIRPKGNLEVAREQPGGVLDPASYTGPIHVLLVCTGNLCRSPMAEGLLRRRRADTSGIEVSSAGLIAGGRLATSEAVAVMAERGIDISAHRSRELSPALIRGADLVIGMARRHVREVGVLDPPALARTFTLKELARRSAADGRPRAGEDVASYLHRLSQDRDDDELLGDDAQDDVADPLGYPIDVYRRTADQLDTLIDRVVERVLGPLTAGAATGDVPSA
jgi:protein-tyrosine phosphatase